MAEMCEEDQEQGPTQASPIPKKHPFILMDDKRFKEWQIYAVI